PTVDDALYLSFYPPCLLGLGLLVRSRVGRFSASVWLDALVGSLSIAALGSALVLPAFLSTMDGGAITVLANLAYPLGDCVLLSVVVGGIALAGWRPGRGLGAIAAALCIFVLTDSVYLYLVMVGTYRPGTLLDAGWPAAFVVLAIGAWQPARRSAVRLEGW